MNNSWYTTQQSVPYTEAVEALQEYEPPSVGFCKASGLSPAQQNTAIIKQNNTIIQLLVKLAEEQEVIKADLKAFRSEKQASSSTNVSLEETQIEELAHKLANLKTGEKKLEPPNRTHRVFVDPQELLRIQLEKLKK